MMNRGGPMGGPGSMGMNRNMGPQQGSGGYGNPPGYGGQPGYGGFGGQRPGGFPGQQAPGFGGHHPGYGGGYDPYYSGYPPQQGPTLREKASGGVKSAIGALSGAKAVVGTAGATAMSKLKRNSAQDPNNPANFPNQGQNMSRPNIQNQSNNLPASLQGNLDPTGMNDNMNGDGNQGTDPNNPNANQNQDANGDRNSVPSSVTGQIQAAAGRRMSALLGNKGGEQPGQPGQHGQAAAQTGTAAVAADQATFIQRPKSKPRSGLVSYGEDQVLMLLPVSDRITRLRLFLEKNTLMARFLLFLLDDNHGTQSLGSDGIRSSGVDPIAAKNLATQQGALENQVPWINPSSGSAHSFSTSPTDLAEEWHYDMSFMKYLVNNSGLYHASSNLSMAEPWNYWRLTLQLMREYMSLKRKMILFLTERKTLMQNLSIPEQLIHPITKKGSASYLVSNVYYLSELENLIAFVDYEVLSLRQTIPAFLGNVKYNHLEKSLYVTYSHFRLERTHLKSSSHMYNLKICVENLHITSLANQTVYRGNKKAMLAQQGGGAGLTPHQQHMYPKLFSDEDLLASQLLQYYDEYVKREQGDPLAILDGRFEALCQHGRLLFEELQKEKQEALVSQIPLSQNQQFGQNQKQGSMTGTTTSLSRLENLKRAYERHLDDRGKFRELRMAMAADLSQTSHKLYSTWQNLRRFRTAQNFQSTAVQLDVTAELHNAEDDERLMKVYLDAHVEEEEMIAEQTGELASFDKSATENRLINEVYSKWRQPGADTYRFNLTWRKEKITNLDDLRNISIEEFERRRKLQSGYLSIQLICCVNGERVGGSGNLPMTWETWTSTNVRNISQLLDNTQNEATGALQRSNCPFTFDLAVHSMPRSVELQVWVGVPREIGLGVCTFSGLRKWVKIGGATVSIPSSEGITRVTHTPIVRQKLVFGTLSNGVGIWNPENSLELAHKSHAIGSQIGSETNSPTAAGGGSGGGGSRQQKGGGAVKAVPKDGFHEKHKHNQVYQEALVEKDLQEALLDATRTTGIMRIRSFWPLPRFQTGKTPSVPPPPLAETTLAESLHKAFDEGHVIPLIHRWHGHYIDEGADPASPVADPNSSNVDSDASKRLLSRTHQLLKELRFDPQHPLIQRRWDDLEGEARGSSHDRDVFLDLVTNYQEQYCALPFLDFQTNVRGSKRFQKLALRAQKSGTTTVGSQRIPAFEKEVRMQSISQSARAIISGTDQTQDGLLVQVKLPTKTEAKDKDGRDITPRPTPRADSKGADDEHLDEETAQNDFIQKIQQRTRMVSRIKKTYTVKTVVFENGQDAVSVDWSERIKIFTNLFTPHRPLKPGAIQRRFDPTSRTAKIHVNVSKIYNAPMRLPTQLSRERGMQVSEIVVETAFTNVEGDEQIYDTGQRVGGLHPDINKHRVFRLTSGRDPDIRLSGEFLRNFTEPLYFNVFDCAEVVPQAGGRASSVNRDVSVRHERRYLGSFMLPWQTILTNSCKVEGRFRVEQPVTLIGYEKNAAQTLMQQNQMMMQQLQAGMMPGFGGGMSGFAGMQGLAGGLPPPRQEDSGIGGVLKTVTGGAVGAAGAVGGALVGAAGVGGAGAGGYPGGTGQQSGYQGGIGFSGTGDNLPGANLNEDPMYIYVSITVDRVLQPPDDGPAAIVPGSETRALLNHIHRWVESCGRWAQQNGIPNALGTDIDGRSRLIQRYITPQEPPLDLFASDLVTDPFAIEKCATYVSLLPFLTDSQMFEGRAVDLWCTSKLFLDISCGDFEEHAILLCNFFNHVDKARTEIDPQYASIKSYCVVVETVPDGDGMYVLRQDSSTGHSELWCPITNRCFFVPRKGVRSPQPQFQQPPAAAAGPDGAPAAPNTGAAVAPILGPEEIANLTFFDKLKYELGLLRGPNSSARFRVTELTNAPPTTFSLNCPVQEVNIVFDADNVWYNMKRQFSPTKEGAVVSGESIIVKLDWDLENPFLWRPLWKDQREKDRIFSSTQGQIDTLQPPLRYEAPNVDKAKVLQSKIEDDLWKRILKERSKGNSGMTTRSNAAIASRCRDICDLLEQHKTCRRKGGNESPLPLNSGVMAQMAAIQGTAAQQNPNQKPPITDRDLNEAFRRIEEEFGGSRGLRVYGVPLNLPYSDTSHLWQAVKNTDIVNLGDEDAEYSVACRVFPYSHRVYSIWVFLVCVTKSTLASEDQNRDRMDNNYGGGRGTMYGSGREGFHSRVGGSMYAGASGYGRNVSSYGGDSGVYGAGRTGYGGGVYGGMGGEGMGGYGGGRGQQSGYGGMGGYGGGQRMY